MTYLEFIILLSGKRKAKLFDNELQDYGDCYIKIKTKKTPKKRLKRIK